MSRRKILLVALLSLLAISGCMFRRLGRDLDRISQFALIKGEAKQSPPNQGNIVVVLTSDGQVVDTFVRALPGPYYFAVPAGTYRIAAFNDTSGDRTYQPGEPAVDFGEVHLTQGQKLEGIDLVLDRSAPPILALAVGPVTKTSSVVAELPDVEVGTVVSLDDPRFTPENGALGLWQPLEFVLRVGPGLYFLEPYDPDKTPVLFVHGATGNPSEFRFLAEHLDRDRFQPWFAYYPSAARLHDVGMVLGRWMQLLYARHRFSHLAVVAHSMGGLVARSAINQITERPESAPLIELDTFVTLSTPWNGHAGAALGVEKAPVVAPSWNDMAPGSDFLRQLPMQALPTRCAYHLFFSYAGGRRGMGGANDGAVTLASQLPLPMQAQAVEVRGFDETHRTILRSAEVAHALNAALGEAAP
jgi:pimeloyl-ACP methyl ester carboxylesterase